MFRAPAQETTETCDVLFYQGMSCSQTQVLKYAGEQKIEATTSEKMWCVGRNHLKPLNAIYQPFIGSEIADVNLQPFHAKYSKLNPINYLGYAASKISNQLNGFRFSAPTIATPNSVTFHAPIISQISIGQETDMNSHRRKYAAWLNKKDRTDNLILWGVSRGTAATFCSFAKEKYPEVKLVVLEGAIDSVDSILFTRAVNMLKSNLVASVVKCSLNAGFSLFTKYRPHGPSPLKSVAEFPENVPVVFITSQIDKEVPCQHTENIANELVKKGKNDVYLLKLQRSTHPNYMFDDVEDRNNYENFIHAIYKKYNLKHDAELASKGEHLIATCCLNGQELKLRAS